MTARWPVALLLAGSCATAPPAPPPPPAPVGSVQVEKVRDELQVTPLELVFSGPRGAVEEEQAVGIRNTGAGPQDLVAIEVVGEQAGSFRLNLGVQLPLILRPASQLAVAVSFAPPPGAPPGVRRAGLRVRFGPRAEEGPRVDLTGLVTTGRAGDDEPPLAMVLDALGFRVDTGGTRLRIGTGAAPLGSEVRAPRFRRARASAVSLYPVARFSSNERVAYGIYKGHPPQLEPLAAVAAFHGQTLNPDLEPDGRTTFDPGPESFGVFEAVGKRTLHTDDGLDGGKHLVRVFPLANRAGAALPDAYAVAFDEDGNGDYQDCVFVIWNVTAVP
jgi:hypothetical protein